MTEEQKAELKAAFEWLRFAAKRADEGFTAPELTLERLIAVVNGLAKGCGVSLGVTSPHTLATVRHYTPAIIDGLHRALEAMIEKVSRMDPGGAEVSFPGVGQLMAMSRVARSVEAAADESRDVEIDDEITTQVWPKTCPKCSRVFLGRENWECLQFAGYVGAVKSGGRRYAVELRNCICASTIGVQVELPMLKPAGAAPAGPSSIAEAIAKADEFHKPIPTVAENAKAATIHVFQKRDEADAAAAPAPERHTEENHYGRDCSLPPNHAGDCLPFPF